MRKYQQTHFNNTNTPKGSVTDVSLRESLIKDAVIKVTQPNTADYPCSTTSRPLVPERVVYGLRTLMIGTGTDLVSTDGDPVAGYYESHTSKVMIDHTQVPTEVMHTLIHELMHVVTEDSGVDVILTDAGVSEEYVVTQLARGFTEILVRNPSLCESILHAAKLHTTNPSTSN